MKHLLNKEIYFYKIHTLLMKAVLSTIFQIMHPYKQWGRGGRGGHSINAAMQSRYKVLYKVLYFRMLIVIFLVYYVLSELITITVTYREFLWTYIGYKKQHMYSMNQLLKNSSNQLFCHVWLFSLLRKIFVICTA